MDRKLRMGMVGGGRDAFIGPVHRIAAQMDNRTELVCGAFSSTQEKSWLSGKDLFLHPDRVYGDYDEMFRNEAALPDCDRMDFVAIVTPNNVHYPAAVAALDAGFHVVCDKPMTMTLDEARDLEGRVSETGKLFCLTHNYTGYPMVKEARDLVSSGELGKVRRIVVEYPQGWLATRLESEGVKQAMWRTDPILAGASSCMGDIGTHCENLAEYVTGLRITEMCADLATFVEGRALDDDGSVPAAIRRRSARVALGQPDCGGRGEWPEAASVWRDGRHRMAAAGTEHSCRSQSGPADGDQANRYPICRRCRCCQRPVAGRPSGGLHRGVREHLQLLRRRGERCHQRR